MGRASMQRFCRRTALSERTNEAIWSLNELYGEGQFDSCRPSEAQLYSLAGLESAVVADVPPADFRETPEASFHVMLGSKASVYPDDEGQLSMAALTPESVISWPASAGSACLDRCLPESHADYVRSVRTRLEKPAEVYKHDVAEEGLAGLHWDPLLKGNRSEYISSVRQLFSRRMVRLQRRRRIEFVGCFFVLKNRESFG